MIHDDQKPKSPFAAFLNAFNGGGEQRPRARMPVARNPGTFGSPPKKRPCNCTGKRRSAG
jgi:hypothetical protein